MCCVGRLKGSMDLVNGPVVHLDLPKAPHLDPPPFWGREGGERGQERGERGARGGERGGPNEGLLDRGARGGERGWVGARGGRGGREGARGSEAGSQKCCKDLANMKLDLSRNAANSLQIEGPGDPTQWGGGWRDGGRDHI